MSEKNQVKSFARKRVFVKVSGVSKADVYQFIYSLEKVFEANRITVSPIIVNKDGTGFHCFINVLLDAEQSSGGTESQ